MFIIEVIIDVILFTSLLISFFTDLKSRKILNIVTYPSIILGIILNTIYFSGLEGTRFSLLGLSVGLFIFGVFYVLGGMGLGDVKLLGAVGALKGYFFTLNSVVYIGLIGGVMAIVFLLISGGLLESVFNIFRSLFNKETKKSRKKIYLPYGPAILFGVTLYYILIKFNLPTLI